MIVHADTNTPGSSETDPRATPIDSRNSAATRARYDRIAPFYDVMQLLNERRFAPHRAALWSRVNGPRVLEAGVGTGMNIPLYPRGVRITAIDLSPRMLERARQRVPRDASVELLEADVQRLPFPDGCFDMVVATFVFCSVPDPVLGLRELRRVLVPGGQLLLMEHVLSTRPVLRRMMRLMNPVVRPLMGANIDRETVENARRAGFVDLQVKDLGPLDIVKGIDARAPERGFMIP
ncbi:MAG: class I SAM-dependent methyltransferase [Chloroflexota bacterium]